jgi:hypothetical protein
MNTIDDLLEDTTLLIDSFESSRDSERLYNRLWHCLRWQQADSDHRITLQIVNLYDLFRRNFDLKDRWMLYSAAKEQIEQGKFNAKACLAFLMHDDDEGIVSTAALDLLAYSEEDSVGLPSGLRSIHGILEQGFARCAGAVFGGAISFGDTRLATVLTSAFRYLSPADVQVAARMQTGLVTHFSIEFWIAVALANVDRDDAAALSVFGSSASALVRARRSTRDPFIFDIKRVYPAQSAQERTILLRHWSLGEYAEYMAAVLYEIEERERRPKLFSSVLAEWALEPRTAPDDRFNPD